MQHTAHAMMTIAATALIAFSSTARAEEGSFDLPAVERGAVVPGVTLGETFTMSMWVTPGTRDGHVAGHPGRASVVIEDGEVVFRIGGADAIAGIYRDTYEVSAPIDDRQFYVAVSMDANGAMTLAVSNGGEGTMVVRGTADPAMIAQLDMMEELVGGVVCSDNLFVGASTPKCGAAFDGRVERFSATDAVIAPSETVGRSGC